DNGSAGPTGAGWDVRGDRAGLGVDAGGSWIVLTGKPGFRSAHRLANDRLPFLRVGAPHIGQVDLMVFSGEPRLRKNVSVQPVDRGTLFGERADVQHLRASAL